MEYCNKIILAPMVRIGTLPTRLLCLKYGADIVYGEEIVDFRILGCKRIENKRMGTVDFVGKDGKIVFRTCDEEKGKVVFQMGTSDPERAVQVAKLVESDVAAIDVNMGCPKPFSISGGMGAALLSQPEKVRNILTSLVQNIKKPITCKIRLLPKIEDTISLVKIIESTGVSAIAIHGRYQHQRSSEAAHYSLIKEVAQTLNIPVIANGGSLDIKNREDIEEFIQKSGCDSAMIARSAQWNPSVFLSKTSTPIPFDSVVKDYLRLMIRYGIDYIESESNAKYVITHMLCDSTVPEFQRTFSATTLEELCDIWGVRSDFTKMEQNLKKFDEDVKKRELEEEENGQKPKRAKQAIEKEVWITLKELKNVAPKSILNLYSQKHQGKLPVYETVEEKSTRQFKCSVTIGNETYACSNWQNSKKIAEHAASVVALISLNVPFEPRDVFRIK